MAADDHWQLIAAFAGAQFAAGYMLHLAGRDLIPLSMKIVQRQLVCHIDALSLRCMLYHA